MTIGLGPCPVSDQYECFCRMLLFPFELTPVPLMVSLSVNEPLHLNCAVKRLFFFKIAVTDVFFK